PDKEQETDQSTRRSARQAEDQGPGMLVTLRPDAEPERLPRLDPYLVKDAANAQLLECGGNQVALADRHSAGHEQHIERQTLLQAALELAWIVGHDGKRPNRGAAVQRQRLEHDAVGVTDLAGPGTLVGFDQLIARGH